RLRPPPTPPLFPYTTLFRSGLAGNQGCFQFTGAPVGIIGFGDLGRAVRALLVPFRNPVTVHDPWLPDEIVRAQDCRPASLGEVQDRKSTRLNSSHVAISYAV